jgi:tetratricopeptide (TPR) repeat protein
MKWILLGAGIGLTSIFYVNIPDRHVYPPVFSKTFPLSTPASFLASMLGMRRLSADIVWMQTLQYYGESEGHHHVELHGLDEHEHEEHGILYPELQQYWQQIIRFDPFFTNVYLTGPTTLGWNLKRYDQAMALLDEGIAALENISQTADVTETGEKHPLIIGKGAYFEELKWKLYTLKSIIVFLHTEEFDKAIPLLEKIVFRKETPENIKVILAQVYEANRYYRKALRLWMDIYDTTRKPDRKQSAQEHIQELSRIIFSG